jgi:hypothetical protein
MAPKMVQDVPHDPHPMDFTTASATDDGKWLCLIEQRPKGERFELWIDRESPVAQAYLKVTGTNHITKQYAAPLPELAGISLPGFNLLGAMPIRVRSQGCPLVTQETDDNYSLNYASANGIVRLKVGTRTASESKFWTGVVVSPITQASGFLAESGDIVTRLACKPMGGVSAELEAMAAAAPQRAKPL